MQVAAPLRFPAQLRDVVRTGDVRFVVTGAGGWLGRATLEMLDDALGDEMPLFVHPFAATARRYRLRSGREIQLSPLPELATLNRGSQPVAIVHYAFLTREKTAAMTGEAYVQSNRAITRLVVGQADRLGAVATFSTSSGAVYRRDRSLETSLTDNPYGFLKREEEEAFTGLAARMGGRAAICRVFNLAGPFLNKDYVLGSMIQDALAMRPIRIRAPHRVVRSYAHVGDVVSVGFAVLLGLADAASRPFDTAGREAVELNDLALRIRSALDRGALEIDRPLLSEGAEDRYVGDGRTFNELATRVGSKGSSLDDCIRETAEYLDALTESPSPDIRVGTSA